MKGEWTKEMKLDAFLGSLESRHLLSEYLRLKIMNKAKRSRRNSR